MSVAETADVISVPPLNVIVFPSVIVCVTGTDASSDISKLNDVVAADQVPSPFKNLS